MAAAAASGGGSALETWHGSVCFNENEDIRFAKFDLRIRPQLIDACSSWAARAKAIAEQVSFGERHEILWWGKELHTASPLEGRRLSPSTGVLAFEIDPQVCEELRSFLADPENYNQHSVLMMSDVPWMGYARYPFVHAKIGVVPSVQEKKTVRIHGHATVNRVLKGVPQVWDVVQEVRRALGLPLPKPGVLQPAGKSIKAMHFLLQDPSQQAEFSWHDDSEDISPESGPHVHSEEMTTVIVSLSETCSGMRIWGCSPVLYDGQGSCVAFPGAALHESLPRRSCSEEPWVVRKLALFFN